MATNIIVTIGKKTLNKNIIKQMIEAGSNIIRFNFSHANHKDALSLLQIIKDLEKDMQIKIPLIGDISGPEVRIFNYSEKTLSKGDQIVIYSASNEMSSDIIYTNLNLALHKISLGQIVRFMDGQLEGIVKNITEKSISVDLLNNAILRENAHLSIPGIEYQLDFLSEKDKNDILFCANNQFDSIALSFIKSHEEILSVKELLKTTLQPNLPIVAKFELIHAIHNVNKILQTADAFFVARGDLGLETDLVQVPIFQKYLIQLCKDAGKPVYIATQMAESMQNNPIPTRAEISDIANAYFDGADALTLSGETAIGNYPIEAVHWMRKILNYSEEISNNQSLFNSYHLDKLYKKHP